MGAQREIRFILSPTPIPDLISIKLNDFGGLVNEQYLLFSTVKEIFEHKSKEETFLETLEQLWPHIKEKIKERIQKTNSLDGNILKLVLVTPNGERTLFSDILQQFILQKGLDF